FADHDVAGLHIAMNDPGSMRFSQRVGNLYPVFQRGRNLQPSRRQHIIERPAVNVLHDDEIRAVLLNDVVDGDDVRMIERGGSLLPPEQMSDPERCHRFVHEAQAASALNHPNIITIHDIIQQNGADFIVMEYIDGRTLDDVLAPGRLEISTALKYGVQIAD